MTVTAAPESTKSLASAPLTFALTNADIPDECSLILMTLLGVVVGGAEPWSMGSARVSFPDSVAATVVVVAPNAVVVAAVVAATVVVVVQAARS